MSEEYNNYNQYTTPEETPAEVTPIVLTQPGAPQKSGNGLGIASIVCGSVSLFCCGGPLSLVGLILGIIGVSRDKRSVTSIVGLVISALSLIAVIAMTIYVAAHPEYFEELTRSFTEAMEQAQRGM